MANLDAAGGIETLSNDQTSIVADLVIVVQADLLQALAHGQ